VLYSYCGCSVVEGVQLLGVFSCWGYCTPARRMRRARPCLCSVTAWGGGHCLGSFSRQPWSVWPALYQSLLETGWGCSWCRTSVCAQFSHKACWRSAPPRSQSSSGSPCQTLASVWCPTAAWPCQDARTTAGQTLWVQVYVQWFVREQFNSKLKKFAAPGLGETMPLNSLELLTECIQLSQSHVDIEDLPCVCGPATGWLEGMPTSSREH